MRIAIVGTGISGLTVAHLLHERHELTLFEAGDHIGGHTNTIAVQLDGEHHQVDTGFIVFNDRNYQKFERLLRRLGVSWQPTDMSFSVSDGAGFEYASTSLGGLFANRRHLADPSFLRMVLEVPRFQRACRRLLARADAGPSLAQWLADERFSERFAQRLIIPQAAAVWSADPRQMWSFPARFLAQFFENHGMLSLRDRPRWRVIQGGSARYVETLVRPFRERIRLGAPVSEIRRDPSFDGVLVRARGGEPERFDQVVVATHSDQALAMLADASERERRVLGAIAYLPNEAVLHTDRRLLPRRRAAWASWNYHLMEDPQAPVVTYHMNRLQSLRSAHELCVTLNRTPAIDPSSVLARVRYAHPVYTPGAVQAQARWPEISGVDRVHYCGAYWGWGFHEDGVISGLRVAERLGGSW